MPSISSSERDLLPSVPTEHISLAAPDEASDVSDLALTSRSCGSVGTID